MPAAALLAAALLTLARPGEAWLAWFHRWPPVPVVAWLLAYLALAWAARRRRWIAALLPFTLFALYLSREVPPFGDTGFWRQHAGRTALYLSEPLSQAVLHLARAHLDLVAPVVGLLAAAAWLLAWRGDRLAGALWYLGSGLHLCFFRGFVENTQLAVPCALLYLALLTRHRASGSRRDIIAAGACLALACLCHGQNVALAPALLLAGRRALLGAAAAAVVTAVVLALLLALGFTFEAGNLGGGANRTLFAPLGSDAPGHEARVAAILTGAAPVAWLAPFLFLRRPRALRDPVTAVAALGGLAFVALVEFDLGFPQDWDVMVALTLPLHLHAARRLPAAAALLPPALAWALMAAFLLPPGTGQPNGPRAALEVAGAPVGEARGPFTIALAPGARAVTLDWRGPPGSLARLYAGSPNPGHGGSACRGFLDVGTPPDYADLRLLFEGSLDGSGFARASLPLPDAPGGFRLSVQGALFPHDRRACNVVLTAAFDLVAP